MAEVCCARRSGEGPVASGRCGWRQPLTRNPGLVDAHMLTFLFADIEDSTVTAGRLEDAQAGMLAHHHRLIRAGLAAHGGEEVHLRGDGVCGCGRTRNC